MASKRGRFFRPILALSRRDVLAYLSEKNIPWREDSTNTDTRFFRNRVRHRLIPLLNESFPNWRTAVTALAETQSLTADFIKEEAAGRIKWGMEREHWKKKKPRSNTEFLLDFLDSSSVSSVVKIPKTSLSTDAKTFFAHPAVIREEALFQAIDTLPAASMRQSTVKRQNIRRFCEGNVTAVDLGPFQLRKDSQRITISAKAEALEPSSISHSSFLTSHLSEFGFSLLINAPGFYNLKGVTIEVIPCCQCGEKTAEGFYASFPLVLRPVLKDDSVKTDGVICAEDRFGVAAIIGSGGAAGSDVLPARRKAQADIFCIVKRQL
jgi:tRNA(Ile)-lysidine synthase